MQINRIRHIFSGGRPQPACRLLITLFLLIAVSGGVFAETRVEWLDRPHDAVSAGVFIISERFDRFFDDTEDEEVGETRIKITIGTEWRESQSLRFRTGASGRIDLPRMERRLNLLVENLDLTEETVTEQDVGDDFNTGLRYLLRQTQLSSINIDGGLRFSDGPILFSRLRLRRKYVFDPHMVRITQFFQWFDREGFAEITRLEYERHLMPKLLFRTRSNAEWGEKTQGVEWQQSLDLANVQQDRHGFGVFAAVSGATVPNTGAQRYQTGLRYRYRVYRDWLFLDMTPSLEFREEDNFKASPLMNIRLESIFGKVRE